MPRSPQPVSPAAEPSPERLLPVRIHTDGGRIFLSVGAASRDLTPAGARHVAGRLSAAADGAALDVAAVNRGHRTPHAFPRPGGLVGLRFDTAALELTEDQALRLADSLADAAEATRDVLALRNAQ